MTTKKTNNNANVSGCSHIDNYRLRPYKPPKERDYFGYIQILEQRLAYKTEDYMELEKRHNEAYQAFEKLKSELQAEKQKVEELQVYIKEMSKGKQKRIIYRPFRKMEEGELWDEYLTQFCYHINEQIASLFQDYEQKTTSLKSKIETKRRFNA